MKRKSPSRKSASRKPSPRKSLTYRDAGVDIDAGDALVDRIKPHARRTLRPGVMAGIGGFGALFAVPRGYREPVLVSGTDGVGTKLKLAFEWNRHDTIGIDLVAMSVNDILTLGAEPLFFLDYYACGKLDVPSATDVVKGIAAGCEMAVEVLRHVDHLRLAPRHATAPAATNSGRRRRRLCRRLLSRRRLGHVAHALGLRGRAVGELQQMEKHVH